MLRVFKGLQSSRYCGALVSQSRESGLHLYIPQPLIRPEIKRKRAGLSNWPPEVMLESNFAGNSAFGIFGFTCTHPILPDTPGR